MKNKYRKINLRSKERLSIFTNLSTMLKAGIPILEAIESLQIDAKGGTKKVLVCMHEALFNGEELSSALEQMPRAFDMISINLIKAAETGGTLETTLADIVKASNKEAVFSDQLRNTMIYPAFVMVVFTGIIILMLTFVLPRVSEVFSSLNVNMPWITRAMIKISQVFIARWKLIVSIIVIFIVGLILLIRANKKRMMRLILRIPFLRKLGTNIDLTRFNRSFGLLMRAGVPIMEALNLAERVVSKKEITAVIEQMKKDISNGKPLADSLDVSDHVVPAIMARSIKTAESTGTLDETLQNLTDYFDEQVAQTLKVLSSLIEPLMIVVVGVLVGFLMIAIIVPIYSMISQINSLPKPQ